MPTNEEDLQAQRERNEQLRAEIAEEQARGAELTAELQGQINAAQLLAETAQLEARLAEVKADNERLENSKPAPLQQAEEQMLAAVRQQQAKEEAEAQRAKAEQEAAERAEAERAEAEAAAAAEAERLAANEAKNEKGNGGN